MDSSNREVKAVLLVGGLGTRLRAVVSSRPKPLARVGDRPFLDLLIRQLRQQEIRRLVLCTGYLAQEIENDLGDGRRWDVEIEYSKEACPLGTAGAVKFAEPFLRGEADFLVMNGDSFMDIDFRELIGFHRSHGGIATMAVARMKNEMRYGTVQVESSRRVSGFAEKSQGDPNGLVNAGIYAFSARMLEHIPLQPSSLEKDIFPKVLEHGIYALEQRGVFIDIGTPEDYARAQELYARLYEAAGRKLGSGASKE